VERLEMTQVRQQQNKARNQTVCLMNQSINQSMSESMNESMNE